VVTLIEAASRGGDSQARGDQIQHFLRTKHQPFPHQAAFPPTCHIRQLPSAVCFYLLLNISSRANILATVVCYICGLSLNHVTEFCLVTSVPSTWTPRTPTPRRRVVFKRLRKRTPSSPWGQASNIAKPYQVHD
jgi:hypothetical protein